MEVLKVDNLTKNFTTSHSFFKEKIIYTAVNNISFAINKSEILGFLGHNGAGKTTTIQMLLGLLKPTSGTIKYFHMDFNKNPYESMKKIGYANGYDRMPGRLTVLENIDIVGRIHGIAKEIRINRIVNLLKKFGMIDILNRQCGSLSAGQSTCAMLVKAFISDPDLVLLDEPSASLDPETAYKVRQFIIEKNQNNNTSILITSHNMNEVSNLCNRVIVLNKGIIVANDAPNHLAKSIGKVSVNLVFDTIFYINQLVSYLDSDSNIEYEINKNIVILRMQENYIAQCLSYLADKKIIYTDIDIVRPTFEDYFLQFLKKEKE